MQNNPNLTTPPGDYSKVSLSLDGGASRPLGVSLISIYYVVSALIGLLAVFLATSRLPSSSESTGVDSLGGAGDFGFLQTMVEEQQRSLESLLWLVVALSLLFVALSLAIGFGLWRMRIWAYYLALISGVFTLTANLCSSLTRPITLSLIVGAAINAFILLYLLRPQTRQAFTN
jgi:uncharacterized membrane protein